MWMFIIAGFLIWRTGLFLIAWIGANLMAFTPRFPYSDILLIPSGLPGWLWSFANFDGVHYLTIAKSGYSAQFTQVFFPLYSLVLGFIHFIFPFLSPIIIGLIISNLCFFLTIIMMWKLYSFDYKKEQIRWMLIFFIFFPTSFFFGSLYTESLFMLLVISSFYFARRKSWWLAGIYASLASATRLAGIFLLPALLWEWLCDNKRRGISILHSPILYLVPLGLISYMVYLQLVFGDWLYFWHVQPVFGAQRSGGTVILLPQVIWRYIKILLTVPVNTESLWISMTEAVSILFAITILLIGHLKKIRLSYLIFSWLAIIVPPLTGTFSSMPRYILVAFPTFIVLGRVKNSWLKIMILSVFSCLLAVFTILFTGGHWVS